MTIHTNNLGYRVKTYACHLALYSNNLTFSGKSCYRSLINNNQGIESEPIILVQFGADEAVDPERLVLRVAIRTGDGTKDLLTLQRINHNLT